MEQDTFLRNVLRISALTPFFYFLTIGLFILWIILTEGHFPSYGNPDPKNYPLFHIFEIISMLLVPIGFILWIFLIILSMINQRWTFIRLYFTIGTFGFLLILLLVRFDPMGVLNWLAD